jgi:hypothetical protein
MIILFTDYTAFYRQQSDRLRNQQAVQTAQNRLKLTISELSNFETLHFGLWVKRSNSQRVQAHRVSRTLGLGLGWLAG